MSHLKKTKQIKLINYDHFPEELVRHRHPCRDHEAYLLQATTTPLLRHGVGSNTRRAVWCVMQLIIESGAVIAPPRGCPEVGQPFTCVAPRIPARVVSGLEGIEVRPVGFRPRHADSFLAVVCTLVLAALSMENPILQQAGEVRAGGRSPDLTETLSIALSDLHPSGSVEACMW